MHKIHVSELINKDITTVFEAISDHRSFLSGGGLSCHLIKKGSPNKNGLNAVRTVRSKQYTLTEVITDFKENKSYDYLITEIKPAIAITHHNGWIECSEEQGNTRVDWHSHFTHNTPIIGYFMGWVLKRQFEKMFIKRLQYLNS